MSHGMKLKKTRRLDSLTHELETLEACPETKRKVHYRDKAGKKRYRTITARTPRQVRRIAALRESLLPKARRNLGR